MTSLLRQNFQTSPAVHGAVDITTCIFRARRILCAFVVPKFILLFIAEGWSAQPYSIYYGLDRRWADDHFFSLRPIH